MFKVGTKQMNKKQLNIFLKILELKSANNGNKKTKILSQIPFEKISIIFKKK